MATTFIFLFLCFTTAFFLPYFFYLFILSFSSFFNSFKPKENTTNANLKKFAFVIPAHNEESGIVKTIQSCQDIEYPKNLCSIYVIADNCSDSTAQVSKNAGAFVFERFHDTKKSKGYALEAFFENFLSQEKSANYEAFVVVDADTLVEKNILNAFCVRLLNGQNWIQCYYTSSNPNSSWRTRLLTFALALFNGVWLKGQTALGLSCSLRGNGMCFQKEALTRFPWKAYSLAEDLEFSWHLRLAGERVWFAPETKVYGEMVSQSGKTADAQRQRWEVGRNLLKKMFSKEILISQKISFSHKWLYWIDIHMPTLAKLCFISVTLLFIDLTLIFVNQIPFFQQDKFGVLGMSLLPFHLLLLCVLVFYCSLPFIIFNLPLSYIREFTKVPFYMAWKFKLLLKPKPKGWVRTERE
jgi:cellulose synthase/poly-beta-1,6-N-acetylglucosamine synthase-like glycosyltransferase